MEDVLCKRCGWAPHPEFCLWREVNTWSKEWETGIAVSKKLFKLHRGCDGIYNAFIFFAVQPKTAVVRCLLVQSQGSPRWTGFSILLCLRTWAGVLLLLEHLSLCHHWCSFGSWELHFKLFNFMCLCTLLMSCATKQKLCRQFKNNDVWNFSLNELLIVAQIVFSISKNAHSFHIKFPKNTADLNINMQ